MLTVGLGVGEASPLKAQRGYDVLTGAQLVLALERGGLHPEQLLARNLRNRTHVASLAQGYFISRLMLADQVLPWLTRWEESADAQAA